MFYINFKPSLCSHYFYGFNGQEKIDETYDVSGSYLDFEYRGYNSRIGRFFVVDPLHKEYPELTPYQFASNNPIGNIEVEGLEGAPVNPNTYGAPAPAGGALIIPINDAYAEDLATKATNPQVIINRQPIPKNCSTGSCTNSKLNQRLVFSPTFENGDSEYSIGAYGLETATLVRNSAATVSTVRGNPNVNTTLANDIIQANNTIANANARIAADQAAGNILPTATNGAVGTIANSYKTTINIEILPVANGGNKLADAQALQANLRAANPNAIVNIVQTATSPRSGRAYGTGELAISVVAETPSF